MFENIIGTSILEVSHKMIERPSQSVYFNHIHNHCELLLFIRGKANYNIDGQIFEPSPYDLIFIPAATYHYLIPTESVPYENYVIGIDPKIIDPEHYKTIFSPPLMTSIKEDDEFISYFTRLDYYHKNYSEKDFLKCAESLINELITYCAYRKNDLKFIHSGSITHIDGIIKYISENIEKPLSADMIATHFMLSKSYIQNLFSQTMHIGIKKYIMQKKIYSAHLDLLNGMSPQDVCEKYSFGDYSVFYRLYRNTFNKSPTKK